PTRPSGRWVARSTIHVRVLIAVGFWRASKPFREKVWAPPVRGEYVIPVVQGANPSPSRAHWKVTPPSSALKVNVASVTSTVPDGPPSMCTTGGVVSTVHVYSAGARLWLPA